MVGAGIFSLLGTAGEVAGTAVWLSFVLAGIIAALQGYSFGKLGAIFPSGGGLLEYVNRGYGPGHIATVTAWLTYAANGIVTAMVALSFGSYASAAFTNDDPTSAKLFAVALVDGDDAAEHRRFVVRGAGPERHRLRGGGHPRVLRCGHDPEQRTSRDSPRPSYPSVRDIVSSVALTFFAFLGFGVVTFTAKDLADPSRQLPRAMAIAIGLATAVYVSVSLGVFGTMSVPDIIAAGPTAIAVAAQPILGDAGFWLMVVTALFATAGATNAGLYPAAGLDGAPGRDGPVPADHGPAAGRTRAGRAAGRGGRRRGHGRVLRPVLHRLDRQRGGADDLRAGDGRPSADPVARPARG